MYEDLTQKRNLGQFYILLDPARFTDPAAFKHRWEMVIVHAIKPASGKSVRLPGKEARSATKRQWKTD